MTRLCAGLRHNCRSPPCVTSFPVVNVGGASCREWSLPSLGGKISARAKKCASEENREKTAVLRVRLAPTPLQKEFRLESEV